MTMLLRNAPVAIVAALFSSQNSAADDVSMPGFGTFDLTRNDGTVSIRVEGKTLPDCPEEMKEEFDTYNSMTIHWNRGVQINGHAWSLVRFTAHTVAARKKQMSSGKATVVFGHRRGVPFATLNVLTSDGGTRCGFGWSYSGVFTPSSK
jgi:hypothetical protein